MPKEKELENQEVDQDENEQETETEETEDEEDDTSTEESDESDEEESDDEEGESSDKPKDKTQKRIDQLTAAKKTLEEQLTESKEALDQARVRSKFFEEKLAKAEQAYSKGVSQAWTFKGKDIYQLTNREFEEAIDMLLTGAEASQTEAERKEWMQQLKECNILRGRGQDIAEQKDKVDQNEQALWEYEWGLVSKALLEKAPQLKEHAIKLNKLISPIFLNRKKDDDAEFAYIELAKGGVSAKFRHVVELMKREGIYDEIQKEDYKKTPNPGNTVGKGSKSTTGSETKTFTRAQIAKMSLAEFERNEKAINKALSKGQIR